MGKYTRLFIDETRQYLAALEGTLEAARQGRADTAALSEGSRLSHTIKGMALFEEQETVAALAFALEKGFGRGASQGIGSALAEGLGKGVRLLGILIDEIERDGRTSSDPRAPMLEIESCAGTGA